MPLVAIVGKANVGKSTLFNRIAGERRAVESPTPGTTRDRVFASYQGKELEITFVDTGGISFGKGTFDQEIIKQAEIAVSDADLILFCLDLKDELSEADKEVAHFLRRKTAKEKVFLVGTKADKPPTTDKLAEFYALGFAEAEMFFVSAIHNAGVGDLLRAVEANLLRRGFTPKTKTEDQKEIALALLGRPNVGKSSLVNSFLQSDQLIVSDIPGTTIDSVDYEVKHEGQTFRLIDTAGVRRRKNREKGIEEFSALRSFKALERANIALLLIDAERGAVHQDQAILEQILEKKTGVIIVVNKWDEEAGGRFAQSEDEKEAARDAFLHHLQAKFSFAPWISVVFVSAVTRKNITKIFTVAQEIHAARHQRIKTAVLNDFLAEVLAKYSLKARGNGLPPKVKFCQQVDTNPPHFLFFTNKPDDVHFSSRRYLENRLRETFGFNGTPIVIEFRQK